MLLHEALQLEPYPFVFFFLPAFSHLFSILCSRTTEEVRKLFLMTVIMVMKMVTMEMVMKEMVTMVM
jgi:hypothetical protein